MIWKRGIAVLVPLLIIISTSLSAQFSKGDVILGATVNFYSRVVPVVDKGIGIIDRNIQFAPKVGFFLTHDFVLGGSIGYRNTYNELNWDPQIRVEKYNALTLGFFARRYFFISEKFSFVFEGAANFERGSNNSVTTEGTNVISDSYEAYSLSVNVRPLLVFLPSPHWGIEGGIGNMGFTHNHNLSNSFTSNTFNLEAGGITFGVTYYFNNK